MLRISKKFFWAMIIVLVLSAIGVGIALACPPNGHEERNVGSPYCDGTSSIQNREARDAVATVVCDKYEWQWSWDDWKYHKVCVKSHTEWNWGPWYPIAAEVDEDSPRCQPEPMKVDICHATSSETNPYTSNTVNVNSVGVASGMNGHRGHGGDIIPTFTYAGVTYPGQGDQSILANGCKIPPPPRTNTLTAEGNGTCDGWSVTAVASEEATLVYNPSQSGPWGSNTAVDVNVDAFWEEGVPSHLNVPLHIVKPEDCDQEPVEVTLCNPDTGVIATFPEDQLPGEPWTEDLSLCRKPPVTPTPPPEYTMIVCLPGQYRAQSVPTDYTGEYSKDVIFNGVDWICWVDLCNTQTMQVERFTTQKSVDTALESGLYKDAPYCQVTPVPPSEETPPTYQNGPQMSLWDRVSEWFMANVWDKLMGK